MPRECEEEENEMSRELIRDIVGAQADISSYSLGSLGIIQSSVFMPQDEFSKCLKRLEDCLRDYHTYQVGLVLLGALCA